MGTRGALSDHIAYEGKCSKRPQGEVYKCLRGVLSIMAYTGRLRAKGVPFSGFRYIKG